MTKKVTLYTKSTCPFCVRAVALLKSKGVDYIEYAYAELTEDALNALNAKTENYSTVPQIFVGDDFIGGFDQLNRLNLRGELDQLLAE